MSTLLVTGGCGFIGSNFVRHILAADPDVTVVNFDALTYAGNLANLDDLARPPALPLRQGRHHRPRRRPRRLPARASTTSSTSRPRATSIAASRTPGRSSAPTCSARRSCSTPPASSPSSATSRCPPTRSTAASAPTGLFTETTPLAPNSPYAASKAAADLLVQSYAHTFGLPALITRCSNNYGPYQFPEKLIPLFITNLLRDEPVPVYGDGGQVRDWIHVLDHCRAVERVWRAGRVGEVYNIGGRCEKTNLELTHTLLDLLGKPRSSDPLRAGPARPRPPLRHRLRQDRARARLAAGRSVRAGACATPSPGIAPTPIGSRGSAPATTSNITSGNTAQGRSRKRRSAGHPHEPRDRTCAESFWRAARARGWAS